MSTPTPSPHSLQMSFLSFPCPRIQELFKNLCHLPSHPGIEQAESAGGRPKPSSKAPGILLVVHQTNKGWCNLFFMLTDTQALKKQRLLSKSRDKEAAEAHSHHTFCKLGSVPLLTRGKEKHVRIQIPSSHCMSPLRLSSAHSEV